ncbi:MAG: GNAT family N-acetyltransferase, partial [Flavobacterium sp.]
FLVIHRLFVSPMAQGKGISSQMIQYAEQYAQTNKYASIRFDTYSLNNTANAVYLKKGYTLVGTVQFRKGVFNCYEKEIVKTELL